jgi:hypothetical protein
MLNWSAAVKSIMPMMLDGIGIPVSQTINSPSARNANNTQHCKIMVANVFDELVNMYKKRKTR